MSQLARSIELNTRERNRLIAVLQQTVERVHSLEREVGKLERRAGMSKGDTAAEARRELRTRRSDLSEISEASEVGLTSLKRTLALIQRGEAEGEVARKELTVIQNQKASINTNPRNRKGDGRDADRRDPQQSDRGQSRRHDPRRDDRGCRG